MTNHRHFIIHKPYGYLSQFVNNQTKRKNKKLLGTLYNFPDGIMAIGRLDEKSEGLLLLTTDGKMSERVRSKEVEKEYYVEVDGIITDQAIGKLKSGVEIGIRSERYTTLPCRAHRVKELLPIMAPTPYSRSERHGPTSWVSIILTEGKFRQIRKMTAAVGFPTLRLIRVRIGHIQLDQLPAGEVIEIETLLPSKP